MDYNQKGKLKCNFKAGEPITKVGASWFNKVANALNNLRVRTISGQINSVFVKGESCKDWCINIPAGGGTAMTLAVCTGVDTGGNGFHEFTACGLDGVVLVGGTVFSDCWLMGDWVRGTWLPVEYGLSSGEKPTYGEVFNSGGTNVVRILGSYYLD